MSFTTGILTPNALMFRHTGVTVCHWHERGSRFKGRSSLTTNNRKTTFKAGKTPCTV